jgi:hypothetical protein
MAIIALYGEIMKNRLIKIFLGIVGAIMQNPPEVIVSNLEKWLNLLGFHEFPDFMHTTMFVEASTWTIRLLVFYLFASVLFSGYKSWKDKKSQKQRELHIPIMEAVDMLKSHSIKGFELTLKAIFSNQHSEHSTDTKQLILFILEQSKNGKLSLFGKKKHLSEEKIRSYDIQLNRLGFDENDMPVIYDFDHKILYKELRVDKKELLNLAKSFSILQVKEELCHGIQI